MSIQQLPVEYRQVFEKLKGYIHSSSQGGLKNQPIERIEAFAHHYLVALSTLSRMRLNPEMRPYLPMCNQMLTEANLLLYPEEQITLRKLWRYFTLVLPAQMWENRWYFIASSAICLACAFISFWVVLNNFEMAGVFMPESLRSTHEMEAYLFSKDAQHEMLTAGRDSSTSDKAYFATALMINNIRVAIMCFVSGILFAIPTVLILVQTGLMLGTLPALFYHGDLVGLGAWLLPHGVPEIGAIFLAGGGGLKLGLAMLRPGTERMGARFRKALMHVASTVVVCFVLLVWAGLVESFVRQSDLSYEVRYIIAGVSVIPYMLLFAWGFIASRKLREEQAIQAIG